MASDPLDALRLTLMQEVLPVGLALVERARLSALRTIRSSSCARRVSRRLASCARASIVCNRGWAIR